MFGIVYKITNMLNNKIYIGQTTKSLGLRWGQHRRASLSYGSNYPLYKAIRLYGIENFKIEKIDVADNSEELNIKEEFWIETFNSYIKHRKGYNLTKGGHNRDDLKNKSWGKHTQEHKEYMKEKFKGRSPSPLAKEKAIESNSLSTINLTTGETFSSAKEMSKYYHISYGFTLELLSGKRRKKDGQIFRYQNEYRKSQADIVQTFVPLHKALPRPIFCVETNERYNSIKEAAEKLNICRTAINNMLSGRTKKANKMTFKYCKENKEL